MLAFSLFVKLTVGKIRLHNFGSHLWLSSFCLLINMSTYANIYTVYSIKGKEKYIILQHEMGHIQDYGHRQMHTDKCSAFSF